MLIKRGTGTIVNVFEEKKDIGEEFDRDNIKVAEEILGECEEKENIVINSRNN